MNSKRHFFKWNINELIALQREYELLELSIQEIANRHKRSVNAILCRLEKEDFIRSWCDAKGFDNYVRCRPELNYYVREDVCGDMCDDELSDSRSSSASSTISDYYDLDDESENDSEFEIGTSSDYDIMSHLKNLGLIFSMKQIMEDISYLIKKFSYSTKSTTAEI
jgi:hypothetical protein